MSGGKYDKRLGAYRDLDTGYGTADNPFPASGSYYETPGGYVYYLYIDDAGHVTTELYGPPVDTYYASLWFLFANIE